MPGWRPPLPLLIVVAAAVLLSLAHTDRIRARAEAALERGMPARAAALARGFVLGQDDRIDPGTVEDFRRSGLSHLLAVSGQNVALLVLLAMPLLAALGMPLRTRLLWAIGLIVAYVPLAGAGPSIQRAGIMGALSAWAAIAGRRSSRFYALLAAAAIMLAVEPAIAADVGWQLSFAAVLGILLLAAPLREAIVSRIGPGGLRRPLAEGAAMTIAATLATAPLIAFHFESFSTTALIANLLALPAVPPAMWLGMLAAAVGQVPGLPVEPLNSVNALLLAYVAQVAAWCGRPSWASLDVGLGAAGLVASYLTIAAAAVLALRLGRRRRIAALRKRNAADGPETSPYRTFPAHRRRVPVVLGCLATVVLLWGASGGGADPRAPHSGLRVSILDIGQGDAILLQPARAPAILVDTGPPAEGLAGKLADAGVDRLGAVVLTHDQSDHAGGLAEVLDTVAVDCLLFGAIGPRTLAQARAAGIPTRRLGRGEAMRTGRLSLEVLWPPVELLGGPLAVEDPNRLSLVVLARWRRFSMLLTGDAEAEAVPLDPGPVDVLKIAHHGSEDAGLAGLLDRIRPRLALISVGEGNPFGHPAPATLATLAAHGVRAMRTDRDGAVVLDVAAQALLVGSGE